MTRLAQAAGNIIEDLDLEQNDGPDDDGAGHAIASLTMWRMLRRAREGISTPRAWASESAFSATRWPATGSPDSTRTGKVSRRAGRGQRDDVRPVTGLDAAQGVPGLLGTYNNRG